MPKDALNRKTCCGKFYYDEEKGCWCNQHGGEVRRGKKFACPGCFKMLKPNGKMRQLKEDPKEPEE